LDLLSNQREISIGKLRIDFAGAGKKLIATTGKSN
jgi:hypothetical protein